MENFTQIKPDKKLFLRGLSVFEEIIRISMFNTYGRVRTDHNLVTTELCFGNYKTEKFSAFKIESIFSGRSIIVYVWPTYVECIALLWEDSRPQWKIRLFSPAQIRANTKKIQNFFS